MLLKFLTCCGPGIPDTVLNFMTWHPLSDAPFARSEQKCSIMWPFPLEQMLPGSRVELGGTYMADGSTFFGANTPTCSQDSVPAPASPMRLTRSGMTQTPRNLNPPGMSVFRHHPPEAWSPIEQFLYAPNDERSCAKRPRLENTGSASSSSASPGVSSSGKYGPFLNVQGLFHMSATRRLMAGVVTGLPGESARPVAVPEIILKAHISSNYRAVLVDHLPEQSRMKLLALPMDVQDTLLRTCMVVSTCWQNIPAIIDDAYSSWWSVWQQASTMAAAPAALGSMRVAVFIARGAWGVPWTALETAILILAKERPDLQFRFELAWIYDDNVASQKVTADVTAAPEVLRGCAVTHRRDVGSFAEDVLSNLVSFKDMFWMALYSVPLVRQLELDCVAGAKLSPHLVMFRPLWSWYRGVQLLDNHLGRASGISIVGSSTTFPEAHARELELYFGSMCWTQSEELGRAERCTQWYVSPSSVEAGGNQKLKPERHPMFRASDPLPDGTTWAVAAAGGPGVALCPPCLSPAYPFKVLQISTGHDLRPGTMMYCQSLRIVSPSNTIKQYGGVPFVLAHLGLLGMRVSAACSKWPCLMEFDIRDGKSRCPPVAYITTCGMHLFCHNCRCVMEGLLSGWELASAAEVIANALLQAASRWRGEAGPSTFRVFSLPAHECSDVCSPPGAE